MTLAPRLQRHFQGLFLQNRIGARDYLECSAKTGEGVRDVFRAAARAASLVRIEKKRGFMGRCVVL